MVQPQQRGSEKMIGMLCIRTSGLSTGLDVTASVVVALTATGADDRAALGTALEIIDQYCCSSS